MEDESYLATTEVNFFHSLTLEDEQEEENQMKMTRCCVPDVKNCKVVDVVVDVLSMMTTTMTTRRQAGKVLLVCTESIAKESYIQ